MEEDQLNPSWTSIDFYYKGFHIKKSVPSSYEADEIVKIVDNYIEKGFEPSWNKDTTKKQLDMDSDWIKDEKKYTCKTCGSEAEFRQGVSKAGKSWKAIFCKETKEHVEWLR